jgi:PEP-CTERM motif
MNTKSALLAFALFLACLTLAAQETIVAFSGEAAASVSVAYTFVGTARFDAVTPLSAGAFERVSPRSRAVAGQVDLLLNTMTSGTTSSFVTTGVDLADRGTDDNAIGAQRAMASAAINPEPATYAWMALGLGAIGFSRRRRQSRAD